ncbi:hypothetical protein Peur_072500 [Populus x canadensis]
MAGSLEHSLKKPLDSCCYMLKPLSVCLPTTILQHGSSCFFYVPLIAPPLPLRDAASTHTMETTPMSDVHQMQILHSSHSYLLKLRQLNCLPKLIVKQLHEYQMKPLLHNNHAHHL